MIAIEINGKVFDVAEDSTLSAVLSLAGFTDGHYAVAVNQVVVPKAERDQYLLHSGDKILLFGAVKGG